MADLIFAAQFVTAQVGKTGLTVTVDVDRYTISDGTRTALVTAGAATEGRRGLYHYRLASADLSLYQYITTFITTNTTVDQQEIPSLGLVVPDALVGSRLATAGYTAPPSSSDNATAAAAAILVTPANKLATGASGIATANVTMQAGVAVAAADANGNVPVDIRAINSNLAAADGLSALSEWYDAESYVPVLGQEIRDAMKLAPSAGAPDAGSVDKHLDDILAVAPDNKPTVAATGETSANVTMQQGVAVAAADANGNVPVIVKAWYDTLVPEPDTAGLPDVGTIRNISDFVAQQVRDAMKLAPNAGAPAAGSVDKHLDDLLTTIGSEIVEGTYTRDDILRIIAAALAGETSGSGTSTVTITGLDGATTRITATVDGNGNRTGMTLDGAA